MAGAPNLTDAKRVAQAARSERLARALRDNLRRRKAQARERTTEPGSDPAAAANGERIERPA
jgi:hypothetical protein